jgi:ubiquinone/menaquinone biosynthesis C-methylase UbiE
MRLWDIKATAYHGLRRIPGVGWILDQEKKNLRSLVSLAGPLPGLLVDAGTGAGSTLDVFPPGASVVGLDRSAAMLKRARARRDIPAAAADAMALPLRDRSVSFLSLIGVAEYLPDPGAFLLEAGRVLKPGGFLLLTVSPEGPLNRVRTLLGHRLFLARPGEWETRLAASGFTVKGKTRSLLQVQILCQMPERRD